MNQDDVEDMEFDYNEEPGDISIGGYSLEELIEMELQDELVPTQCPHDCFVEPDGECPHGYRSLLVDAGLI